MNAEEGKKDVCGQKHERKNTISFFILRSGGRIYFLACTADTPFLWVSFPYVSCQAGVLMKQNDTGSLSLTLLHPPNTLVSASQERFSQPLLSPFFPRTRSDMWDPVWFKLGESAVFLTPMGYLQLPIVVLSALCPGSILSILQAIEKTYRAKIIFRGREGWAVDISKSLKSEDSTAVPSSVWRPSETF